MIADPLTEGPLKWERHQYATGHIPPQEQENKLPSFAKVRVLVMR